MINWLSRLLSRSRAITPEPVEPEVMSGPPGDGWHIWAYQPPRREDLIECWRLSWGTAHVMQAKSMPPWANVIGLYWRPWTGETIEHGATLTVTNSEARVLAAGGRR